MNDDLSTDYLYQVLFFMITSKKKLIVIGGGAAGFFCAVNAARLNENMEITIVERTDKVLQKVKISGGGRCNVTHACFEIDEMAARYPRGERFVRKAFHQFFTKDTIDWFASRGVALKVETDGRVFPKANDSQAIIDCLLRELHLYKIALQLKHVVEKIEPLTAGFRIKLKNGEALHADFVVLACGGFQKMEQFQWLEHLDLKIIPPVPSLFTFNFPDHSLCQLMGISVTNATVKISGSKLQTSGPILITHWGLSGPAVLRLSAFAARLLAESNYQFSVIINWSADYNEQTFANKIQELKKQAPTQKTINGNFTGLPARLWEYFLATSGIHTDKRWADLSSLMIHQLAKNICTYKMEAKGKTTFKEEFVTAGGVALSEVDVNTMMSKKYDGLYFCGEIMDVDGITGGYNFQHAWTSGFIAAKHLAGRKKSE